MWPIVRDFFTVKSVAVRNLRIVLGVFGAAIAAGQIPIPDSYEWIGYVIVGISGAITQQSPTLFAKQ